MTDSVREGAGAEGAESLRPLLGTVNLLSGDAGGYCSDGVCHYPLPSVEKAE